MRVLCKDKTDEDLARMSAKDPRHYVCLVERYEKSLTNYIGRLTKLSPQDHQDILQEVMLKAYRNINSFDANLKFSSWIYRITHNETVSFLRKRGRIEQTSIDEPAGEQILAQLIEEETPDDLMQRKDLAAHMNHIISAMDGKYRDVLILRYLEEKDYQDISDILQLPAGTIATLIHRARAQFIKRVRDEGMIDINSSAKTKSVAKGE